MGIYLGQLPPAEVARFKAELAETVVANFCYPRFFDHRSDSLQTRPVDRSKRQEVWLYLSSVDFTAWSRVDLTSADFQHHIERLFIQFVQRNRSFFGAQGRRRMFDIRMSISTCAGSVAQRLRSHLTSQPITPPFGSPRSVLSWNTTPISGHTEPGWEQIMASTIELQHQLQEWRGEPRTVGDGVEEPVAVGSRASQSSRSSAAEAATPLSTANGQGRRSSRPQQGTASPVNPLNPAISFDYSIVAAQQPTMPTPPITTHASQPLAQPVQYNRGTAAPAPNPAMVSAASAVPTSPVTPNTLKATVQTPSGPVPVSPVVPRRPTGSLPQPTEQNVAMRQPAGGTRSRSATAPTPVMSAASPARPTAQPVSRGDSSLAASSSSTVVAPTPTGPHPTRNGNVSSSVANFSAGSMTANNAGQREVFGIGEDDVAIFEQMRHQLVIWLRIEAVSSGLEVAGQGAPQLLEMLRQQGRHDETRLQVVSTLLNLANQVMKTGTVSVLDYKQALMFHLMHTKRS